MPAASDVIFRRATPDDGSGIRTCFYRAHEVLYYQSPMVALNHVLSQRWTPALGGSIFVGAASAAAHLFDCDWVVAAPIGIVSVGLVIFAFLCFCFILSRSGWKQVIDITVTERDISPAHFVREYFEKKNICAVAVDSTTGNVVGCTSVLIGSSANAMKHPDVPALKEDGSVGLVTRVGVVPERHGQGIGKKVVQLALEYARGQGIQRLFLMTTSSQLPAILMYRSLGFTEFMRIPIFSQLGVYEIVMEKWISD